MFSPSHAMPIPNLSPWLYSVFPSSSFIISICCAVLCCAWYLFDSSLDSPILLPVLDTQPYSSLVNK